MNNVTNTLSDKKITKIKVIDLDELYNFVVGDFFSWNHLVFEKCCLKLSYLQIQIQTIKKMLYRKMTKIKIIDIDNLYNFIVDNFFSWNHLVFKNIVWSCYIFKFKFKLFKKCYIEKKPK